MAAHLRSVRAGHKGVVTKRLTDLEVILQATPLDKDQLEQFRIILQEKFKLLTKLSDDIVAELHDETEIATEIEGNEGLCDQVRSAIFRINKALSAPPHVSSPASTSPPPSPGEGRHTITPTVSRMKLPKLTLTPFDGNYTRWCTFWDSYKSAVHNNPELPDIVKFNYLQSLLQKSAKESIAGLALTAANYGEAIDILTKRFGDKSQITAKHMEALMSVEAVTSNNNLPALRRLFDTLEVHIRGLQSLGVPQSSYGALLSPVILTKLPQETRIIISRKVASDQWELGPILEALLAEIQAREKAGVTPHNSHNHPNRQRREQSTGATLATKANAISCCYCQGDHDPISCTVVVGSEARHKALRNQGRCFNCLKRNHLSRECRAPPRCSDCKRKHHPSICNKLKGESKDSSSRDAVSLQVNEPVALDPEAPSFKPRSCSSLHTNTNHMVLLQLAKGKVFNLRDPSLEEEVQIILDCGSQKSYITDRIKRKLHIKADGRRDVSILTFGSSRERAQSCDIVRLGIRTIEGSHLELRLLSVPLICSQVSPTPLRFCKEKYDYLKSLDLADSSEEREPDILIGSDYYWSVVTGEIVRGEERDPVAVHTKLGWILSGPVSFSGNDISPSLITHVYKVDSSPSLKELDNTLKTFWDLESIGIADTEVSVYEQFSSNVIFKNGRYEVNLPWRDPCLSLPDNLSLSQKRLLSLLKRLRREPSVLKDYDSIIQQQIKLGIVEVVENPYELTSSRIHYLPHHAVVRRDKDTTKLRIVYDASAKDQGPSLNDSLYVGPKFHQLILDILLRFRVHRVGLIADIEKAFLMISIAEKDRDVLRFVWVESIDEDPPKFLVLRFTRVVFGVSCSPFLLNATIKHHLNTHIHPDPELVSRLSRSFYVDDVVTGAPNEEAAFALYSDSKALMREGGFNLCKFTTNCPVLQDKINTSEGRPDKKGENDTYAKATLSQNPITFRGQRKVLGVIWDIESDNIVYDFNHLSEAILATEPTKRQIVSVTGRFYDPLGIIQPVIVTFKIYIQELCRVGITWDEPLQGDLLERWQLLVESLRSCQPITIPRYYASSFDRIDSFQLCGFCDASNSAYAAAIFLLMRKGTEWTTKIVASKSRVSPLKPQTIPRLELMGALLLARLIVSVTNSLSSELRLDPPVCYTDSKITLFWLRGTDKDWKPFVHNRVKEIRQLVAVEHWYHCPGKDNPADAPSRGMTPTELREHTLWWEGPSWLGFEKEDNYTTELPVECMVELKGQRSRVLLMSNDHRISEIMNINNYSTMIKLLRITALLVLFGNRLRKQKMNCDITVSDLDKAEQLWLHDVQGELIGQKDFHVLKQQLDLFYDSSGIWRCGGRISKSDLPYSTKHPVVLPRGHRFTLLAIQQAHSRVCHNGTKETLTELRAKYWVVKGRSLVKQIIFSCHVCRRYEGLPYKAPPPPPLPSFRVTKQPPFTFTGVDYAGPLLVRPDHPVHAPCEQKVWLCVYTCYVTRAVHIDIVTNLSCQSFIRSFKRFTARRGLPHKMISDNASTFKSAASVIKQVITEPAVSRYLSGLKVEWCHNLEKAPWWGGAFERIIGMTKRCLRKIVGRAKFTYDELSTAVTEIESILNSRPLSFISSEDLEEPLTPFHLLNGRRLSNLPDELCFRKIEEEYTTESSAVLLNKRLRHLQVTLDKFWDRWKKEYLINLRERYYKNKQSPRSLNISRGDIVIVHTDQEARGFWRLGRVTDLIIGNDGQVRGAEVYTLTGDNRPSLLRRPLQRLYPLEIGCEEVITPPPQDPSSIHSDITDTTKSELPQDTDSLRRTRPSRAAAREARDKIVARLCED